MQSPNWPYDQQQLVSTVAPGSASGVVTIHPKRVRWAQIAPYLAALVGVAVATAALALFLTWKGSMQAQVSQLRHEVASTQAQLSAAADSGQSQLSRLSRHVASMSTAVNAITLQVGPFRQVCTTDLTGPNGPAAFNFPCRQGR